MMFCFFIFQREHQISPVMKSSSRYLSSFIALWSYTILMGCLGNLKNWEDWRRDGTLRSWVCRFFLGGPYKIPQAGFTMEISNWQNGGWSVVFFTLEGMEKTANDSGWSTSITWMFGHLLIQLIYFTMVKYCFIPVRREVWFKKTKKPLVDYASSRFPFWNLSTSWRMCNLVFGS